MSTTRPYFNLTNAQILAGLLDGDVSYLAEAKFRKGAPIAAAAKAITAKPKAKPARKAQAAAVKATRTDAQIMATQLRKLAWAMRCEGLGTYAECLVKVGGTPAK